MSVWLLSAVCGRKVWGLDTSSNTGTEGPVCEPLGWDQMAGRAYILLSFSYFCATNCVSLLTACCTSTYSRFIHTLLDLSECGKGCSPRVKMLEPTDEVTSGLAAPHLVALLCLNPPGGPSRSSRPAHRALLLSSVTSTSSVFLLLL